MQGNFKLHKQDVINFPVNLPCRKLLIDMIVITRLFSIELPHRLLVCPLVLESLWELVYNCFRGEVSAEMDENEKLIFLQMEKFAPSRYGWIISFFWKAKKPQKAIASGQTCWSEQNSEHPNKKGFKKLNQLSFSSLREGGEGKLFSFCWFACRSNMSVIEHSTNVRMQTRFISFK